MFMKGGELVSSGYKAKKVLVTYRGEGILPPGVQYSLVQIENGEAVFEESEDGSGTLFKIHWADDRGDHFAGWVATSHSYEYVIPADRTKKAFKYVYPAGTYGIEEINGIARPVANDPKAEPVATLIPKK